MASVAFRSALVLTLSALFIYFASLRGWPQSIHHSFRTYSSSLAKQPYSAAQSFVSSTQPAIYRAPSKSFLSASPTTVVVSSTVTTTVVVTPASAAPTSHLPAAYTPVSQDPSFCEDRFGLQYLDNFNSTAIEYCSATSRSSVTCFHSQTTPDRVDSFCVGSSSDFDVESRRFVLACDQKENPLQNVVRPTPRLNQLHKYWYETGPGWLMENSITLRDSSAVAAAAAVEKPQENILLLKREGGENLWHSLMELFAASMTLDVLSLASHPETGRPMLDDAERARTRVVIMDDAEDGPYAALWPLLSPLPVSRLRDPASIPASANIILPIAGGANTLWQGDWDALGCSQSPLLETFVNRVLDLFGLTRRVEPVAGKVRVTFIDRRGTRKLVDQEAHLAALNALGLDMDLRVVDFASMSLLEQIQVARTTDVLIGVHGAGLTREYCKLHREERGGIADATQDSMFMRHGSAVVEVMPHNLQHRGFRNIAHLSSHNYFRIHARDSNGDVDWHGPDVAVEFERLIDVVAAAVKGMYNQDLHDMDAN